MNGDKRKSLVILLILLFFSFSSSGQSKFSASINGYLSNMQSVMFENTEGQWVNDNLVHNRLNFKAYFGNHLQFAAEIRNRFIFGETVKYFPGYEKLLEKDRGWLDMTANLISDTSFILNTSMDRLYLDFSLGSFQMTAGRQRINWGMNYVWNPNDLFNAYSFFDFDYVEKPGSDALRLQYYLSSSSHLEMVGKLNHEKKYSMAALLRFNLASFDYQLLGGIIDQDEYALGAGFSGYIGPLTLNAEVTFLDPVKDEDPRKNAIITGAGAGYNTPFNLFIQVEYLYNSAANTSCIGSFIDFYYRNLTIRDLSFAPHTFFGSLTYPLTPLINIGLTGMYFVKLDGFYAGPSLDLSLCQNFDLSFIVQHFSIALQPDVEEHETLGFLRLKWSF